MYYSSAIGATVNRWSFSKDYTRLSDQKIFAANNERHAGWQNVDGSFADVTENLGQQSKSDFEDPVYYRGLGFAGENFGFAYLSNGSLHFITSFIIGGVKEALIKCVCGALRIFCHSFVAIS